MATNKPISLMEAIEARVPDDMSEKLAREERIKIQKETKHAFVQERERSQKLQKFSNICEFNLKVAAEQIDGAYLAPKGIIIQSPTIGRVRDFVMNMVNQDMTGVSEMAIIRAVDIIPGDNFAAQEADSAEIKNASGLVSIQIKDKKIELPFIVTDGSFVPFEVIQRNGERVPYSTENLKKIIKALHAAPSNAEMKSTDTAYGDLATALTPATSKGFMEDIVKIKNRFSRRQSNPGYLGSIASTLDDMMEKTARMKSLSDGEIRKISGDILKEAHSALADGFEKRAEATGKLINMIPKDDDFDYVDVSHFQNGEIISFPYREKKTITKKYGLVCKQFMDTPLNPNTELAAIIVCPAGEYVFLKHGDKMLCDINYDKTPFQISTKQLIKVPEGENFLLLSENDFTAPLEVSYSIKPNHEDKSKTTRPEAVNVIRTNMKAIMEGTVPPTDVVIAFLDTTPVEFEKSTYQDFAQKRVAETGSTIEEYSKKHTNLAGREHFFVANSNIKAIMLKTILTGIIRDKDEYFGTPMFEEILDPIHKEASAEYVTVTCDAPYNDLYSVVVRYTNRDNKIFGVQVKEFKDIAGFKAKGMLKTLGFSAENANAIVDKAKKDKMIAVPLPDSEKVEALFGGNEMTGFLQDLKDVKKTIMGDDKLQQGVANFVGDKILGLVNAVTDPVASALDKLSSLNSLARQNAEYFEKIAMHTESVEYQNLARAQMLSALFLEKTANTFSGEIYPKIKGIADQVVEMKPHLEKMAYDLDALRANQRANSFEIIDSGAIRSSIETIDQLYKAARAVQVIYG